MWKRWLMILLLVLGCMLPGRAMACEEGNAPAFLAYEAFLREYGEAIAEDRDVAGQWQVSAAAKTAGLDGTGYAFAWIGEEEIPELLIGDLENWHVWQAYIWWNGRIYSLYPDGDPGGEMWLTEDGMLYLEIATADWGYSAWSFKYPGATARSFVAGYEQDLGTGTVRFFCDEYDAEGMPVWHETHMGVEHIRAMMPSTRMMELDWRPLREMCANPVS